MKTGRGYKKKRKKEEEKKKRKKKRELKTLKRFDKHVVIRGKKEETNP